MGGGVGGGSEGLKVGFYGDFCILAHTVTM